LLQLKFSVPKGKKRKGAARKREGRGPIWLLTCKKGGRVPATHWEKGHFPLNGGDCASILEKEHFRRGGGALFGTFRGK